MTSGKNVKTENLDTEIVVIGGGSSGMAAALTAAEKGCSNIIVIEKAGIGGNSAMAHDVFAAESPVQRQMGVDASRDELFKIAMEWAHWSKVNPRIVRAFDTSMLCRFGIVDNIISTTLAFDCLASMRFWCTDI